jgi:hypothetical protein
MVPCPLFPAGPTRKMKLKQFCAQRQDNNSDESAKPAAMKEIILPVTNVI